MWFSNKLNNLFDNGTSKVNNKNSLLPNLDPAYPPKPNKLTPLYSKKRSEISNIDESIFAKKEASPREDKTFARDSSRRSTFREKLKNELSLIDSNLNKEALLNEEKKLKKKKKKKNSAHADEDTVVAFNNNDSGNNTLNTTELTDDQSMVMPVENEKDTDHFDKSDKIAAFFKSNNLTNSIEEIWNTQHLKPNIDESVNLGTIVEEFSDSKLRNKVLGARRVQEVSTLEETTEQNHSKPMASTRDNTEISTRFSMKRPKSSGTFFRSPVDNVSGRFQ